jgi:hypothetical protein
MALCSSTVISRLESLSDVSSDPVLWLSNSGSCEKWATFGGVVLIRQPFDQGQLISGLSPQLSRIILLRRCHCAGLEPSADHSTVVPDLDSW